MILDLDSVPDLDSPSEFDSFTEADVATVKAELEAALASYATAKSRYNSLSATKLSMDCPDTPIDAKAPPFNQYNLNPKARTCNPIITSWRNAKPAAASLEAEVEKLKDKVVFMTDQLIKETTSLELKEKLEQAKEDTKQKVEGTFQAVGKTREKKAQRWLIYVIVGVLALVIILILIKAIKK